MNTSTTPGRLAVGLQLPIQARSSLFAEPWESEAGADELAEIARAADRAGFDYVGVCDHTAIPVERAGTMGTTWWDTVATLGWLAGITERVRLLSHVYVPAHRHPLQVAKAFATLDVVSGGRVVLGVGAGHVEEEFELVGESFARRGELLDEAIDALRTAFTEEYPALPGPRWASAENGLGPRPIQPDGPPIWVGGGSAPARRRAAIRGDGWLPQGPVTARTVAELRELREAAGQRGPFTVGALAGGVHVGELAGDMEGPTLSGSADRIAHVLLRFAAMGVDQVQIRPRSRSAAEYVEQLERFGAEVLPSLTLP